MTRARIGCVGRATAPRQRGIALVLALWVTVLLTVIAGGFAYDMRAEALAARNAVSSAQARLVADGAIERVAYELSRPRVADAWNPDGQARTWQDGDARVVATAVDETAKIDVNTATDALMKSLPITIGGADEATAAGLVDAMADWRDPDDLRRPQGAEDADYRAADSKFRPANAPFETVGEVARVLGMAPAIFARIAPSLTVYTRQPGINPATASRDVLLAIPGATPDLVDAFLQQRADALAQKLPVPPFLPAQAYGTGAIPVWRIRAEATMPDGVTFVREAVVRPSADASRPLIALAWTEGRAAQPDPAPAPGTAPIQKTEVDDARRS